MLHHFEDSPPDQIKSVNQPEAQKETGRELVGVGTTNAQLRLSAKREPKRRFFRRRAASAPTGPTNLTAVFTGALMLLVVALINLGAGRKE